MALFDMACKKCGEVFEFLKIRTDEIPTCPKCKSKKVIKIFTNMFSIRMNADDILKSLPDPQPPLSELIGKTRQGCEGGFKELENEKRELKDYTRKKDKHGNSVWLPKRRQYFT